MNTKKINCDQMIKIIQNGGQQDIFDLNAGRAELATVADQICHVASFLKFQIFESLLLNNGFESK